ncbi:MAG: cytochrome C oxidase subunit IV family protein [Flavobacteriales bacterium]
MERDDLLVNDSYALGAHHDEAKGKKVRKKIIQVTILLTAITALEVFLGGVIKQDNGMWEAVKWSFIIMTLVKAAFIVLVFMHLGDERKNLKWVILGPYLLFAVYLIIILVREGSDIAGMLSKYLGS